MLPFDPTQPTPILDPNNPASALYPPALYQGLGLQFTGTPMQDPNAAPQGPLAAALARLQSAGDAGAPAAPMPPPAAAPQPLTAQDLMAQQPAAPDLPTPPQYAQSFGDLPADQQARANQESLARMAQAFGAAPSGQFGAALANAAAARFGTQDAAVQQYQKLQDLQYQRDLINSEQQGKASAQTATAQREQQQAQQRANLANSIAAQLGPNDSQSQMARMYALAGDDKGLQGIADAMPTRIAMKQRGVNVDDPISVKDWTDQHAAQLSTADAVAKARALGPVTAQTAALEEQARLPYQQQMAAYSASLAQSREIAMAKLNDQLMQGRSVNEALTHLSEQEQMALFNRQLQNSAASQPLTQTEATKALQSQVSEQYKALLQDAKGDKVSYKGQELLPSQALEAIRHDMGLSGPQLAPGAGIAAPGSISMPTPAPMPGDPDFRNVLGIHDSPLAARTGSTAGAPTGAAGPPNLATVTARGQAPGQVPPVTGAEVSATAGLVSSLGEAGARTYLAGKGVSPSKIDALLSEAQQ
jgi:hypothetical protein